MLKIGSVIEGKYKILSEIGHGGMSVVYMALNERANKTWAIKEVRKDGVKDFEVVRQNLMVETEMLKRLRHPNLPSIVDVLDSADTFLIVMDYIEGNPLSQLLKEYGAQKQEDVIAWAKQLCNVLGYLHSQDPPIIYRDMKPANVMLKPDGNVTLIDFGTAREFKKQNVEDTVCLGTLGYAAPEQFGGHGQTDGRTDIYCLGATLYHLVTGMNPCEPPYEIKPIREINARLSEGLEQIILKCTQKDPERRYQNCAELMYDLQEYNNIDKKHIKIKKKKLAVFSASVGLSAVMAITGFVTQQSGIKLKQETYSSKIESGNQEDNVEKAEEDYLDAIEIDSTKTEAYEQLVTLYQKDEEVTQEEFQKLEAELDVDSIEKGDSFGQLCYEMGELYWDYYTYDSTTKMKSTKRWMDLAEEYGNNQFADNEQLKIDAYRVIAQFYIDVLQNDPKDEKKENAGDQWKDYWNNLKSIIQQMQTEVKNAARGRVVLLDTYKISIQAVTVYGNYIKQSVSLEEMTEFIQEIETGLQELDLSGENNIKTRDELLLEVQKANVKIQAMEDKEEAQ
jgi:serine/threonine-protein kinase